MPDDPDPPRKYYGFKAKEFEVANPHLAPTPSEAPTAPTPDLPSPASVSPSPRLPVSASPPLPALLAVPVDLIPPVPAPHLPADPGRIDVRDLNRLAATGLPLLSKERSPVAENEIHVVLRDNLARANAAGLNDVTIDPNYRSPRQRRLRRFCILLPLVNIPLGLAAAGAGVKSQAGAIVFVCCIAAMAMTTARLIWATFFLNTD